MFRSENPTLLSWERVKSFLFHLKPLELLSPSTIKLYRNANVWRGIKSKNKRTVKKSWYLASRTVSRVFLYGEFTLWVEIEETESEKPYFTQCSMLEFNEYFIKVPFRVASDDNTFTIFGRRMKRDGINKRFEKYVTRHIIVNSTPRHVPSLLLSLALSLHTCPHLMTIWPSLSTFFHWFEYLTGETDYLTRR